MISLIIPFGSRDPRRQRIFDWVIARWEALYPDWEICLGSSDLDNFNRSAARNSAFERSSGDLIVISDADTITTPENVNEALDLADRGDWVIAHQSYYSLTESFTDTLLDENPTINVGGLAWAANWKMVNKSQAGVLVMPREAFEHVGGYDERFQGWGYEDNAFASKMDGRWSPHVRTTGPMLHLWHDPGENFQQPHIKYNEQLLRDIRNGL